MSSDFIDSLTFLTEDECRVLREQNFTDPEDFAHVTISRLEAPPYRLTTGKASKLLRAAGAGTPVVNNVAITHAEPPSLANRIDAALLAARDDVSAAGLLVELGVPLVVLAADDKIDPEATKAMRQHVAAGAPAGATWQGQRIAKTTTLSTPPVWCSPRTGQPLQAGKDEITETAWGELRLDGLREAAFGYEQGMFANMPDSFVFEQLRVNGLGIRDKIRVRMKALGVTPESMDRVVVFRAEPRGHVEVGFHGDRRTPKPGSLVGNLRALLQASFSADELRRFVSHNIGSDFAANLPSPGVSLAELAFAVAENLIRHGYIKRELRDALRSARPNRAADIDAVFSAAGI